MPRIIRIGHTRCDETNAYTLVAVPDDWTDEIIREKLHDARKIYLEYIRTARQSTTPPNDYQPYGGPPFKKYPDRTVADITAEWEAKGEVWKAWNAEQEKTRRTFTDVLRDLDFISLWSKEVEIPRFEVDWGHMHGTRIDYENTADNTLPRPSKIVNPDEEDDDFFY